MDLYIAQTTTLVYSPPMCHFTIRAAFLEDMAEVLGAGGGTP